MKTTDMPGTGHLSDFDTRLAASTTRFEEAPIDLGSESESLRNANGADMIQQVTKRIGHLKSRLEESHGFDPATGAVRFAVTDRLRRAMEVELHHLESSALPYTQARAAEIEARKAQLPTLEQQLQAQAERQQRINAAALRRADELEIEEMAQRIRSQRKHSGSPG